MHRSTTKHFLAAILCTMIVGSAHANYITITGEIFGTTYMVKVVAETTIDADVLQTNIENRLEEIDSRMSTYRADSDVSRFNEAGVDEWFPVHQETAQLVQRAIDISHQTNGAFDVTVGPAVALWNFGAAHSTEFEIPAEEAVQAVLQRIGSDKIQVQLEPPALKKSVAGLEIDLSAIAKGYAVDAIAEVLSEYNNYMVEIGGEVRAQGSRPLGDGWRIGVEAPTKDKRSISEVLTLDNTALATSGDYRNFFVHDGVTYSHTIDPKTGRPVDHELTSVSVLAADCATADALATGILVMGTERGQLFATENSIDALLSSLDGEQKLTNTSTSGFPSNNKQSSIGSFLGMFLVTALVFGLAVLGMAIGTIISNRRLQGSCGGMAGIKDSGGNTICDMCTKPSPECAGEPDTKIAAS